MNCLKPIAGFAATLAHMDRSSSQAYAVLVLNQTRFPMAWTNIARAEHNRDLLRPPSDLTQRDEKRVSHAATEQEKPETVRPERRSSERALRQSV